MKNQTCTGTPRLHGIRQSRFVILSVVLLSPVLFLAGCKKENNPPGPVTGTLIINAEHYADGAPLVKNQMIYSNAAGNVYQVTGLKYFISDITLYAKGGSGQITGKQQDIFYIDIDIPATHGITIKDEIGAGDYDSISFVFGITEEKNTSNRFVNPPESLMAWPQVLGGGYHYMMLDGKWRDPDSIVRSFNLHLGIGQLYNGPGFNTDSIYAYVQNWFRVSLPGSGFSLGAGQTVSMTLRMNIENWFKEPYVYDFNYWGGGIMQKQGAMEQVCRNGWNVFSVEKNTSNETRLPVQTSDGR